MKKSNAQKLFPALVAGAAILAASGCCCGNADGSSAPTSARIDAGTPHYTFPPSESATREKVVFKNRFGIELVGDLYLPKNRATGERLAAVVVGHPFGGVKEQTSGLHAQKLAERGFAALAFDAAFYGESGGEPRHIEAPEIRVEDFSAAVDFLCSDARVDPARVGVLGICGGACYAVSAAQIDHRIKAVATVSMYDMGRARRQGMKDSIPYEQRMKTLDEIGAQRSREFAGEPRRDIRALPEKRTADLPDWAAEYLDYYDAPRGHHPRSDARYSFTSLAPMMNFFPFAQIETISPRPMLFVVGERAMSAYFSEDAHARAAAPKELFVVPGATHVDLYDNAEFQKISLPKIEAFFRTAL